MNFPPLSMHSPAYALTDDEALLDEIQQRALRYFLTQSHPRTGLVRDHAGNFKKIPSPTASIAATGFGLGVYAMGVERGWIDLETAKERTLKALEFFWTQAEEEHGFFYHFLDPETGKRSRGSELSPMDTALLLAGVLFAGEYYEEAFLRELARQIYERVDWPWMLNGGKTFAHAWTTEKGFHALRWDHFDESILMYLMAMGSSTHPIPSESWDAIARPVGSYRRYHLIQMPPLFTHQYPHVWVDFRNKHDAYADYFQNSVHATLANRAFAMDQAGLYKTYGPDTWGLTAVNGPFGYRAYGAPPGWAEHDGTVAPAACGSSIVFTPEESLACLKNLYTNFGGPPKKREASLASGGKLWGEYGFSGAFNLERSWFDDQVTGVDLGALALMIENYRSELFWRTMNQNVPLEEGMAKAGFEKGTRPPAWPEPPEYRAPYVLGGIRVDGYLKDWPSGPPLVLDFSHKEIGNFDGAEDLRGEIRFAWDEYALYFYVKVMDRSLMLRKRGSLLWQDDCLELFMDPAGDGLEWKNEEDYQIGFRPDLESEKAHVWSWFQNEDPSRNGEVLARGFTDARGYFLEGRVGWAYLNFSPGAGSVLRLSPALHDSDQDRTQGKLNWFFRNEEGYKKFMLGKILLEPSTSGG